MKSKKIISLILPLNVIIFLFAIVFTDKIDFGNLKRSLIIIGAVILVAACEFLLLVIGDRWDKKATQHVRQLALENGLEVEEKIRHLEQKLRDPGIQSSAETLCKLDVWLQVLHREAVRLRSEIAALESTR